jgi:ribosome-associated toxin RatA of RatAB toxin-antitoxin module
MPTVNASVWIDAPVERVYAIAKDSASFPEYMKDVQSITKVEEEGNRVVSDWVGIISTFGIKIRWRQEDLWDDASHTCHFKQLAGDYDKFGGTWTFTEEKSGCRLDTALDYEYNVPTLGPLVKKVIFNLVVKNLDGMNEAFKSRAEAPA